MSREPVTEHSQRKAEVLELLSDRGEMTVSQLSAATSTTESNVRGVLSRLSNDDAVEKEGGEFTPGRGSTRAVYSIAPRGERWLTWWYSH